MEVFITAPQGAGKTYTARRLADVYVNSQSIRSANSHIFFELEGSIPGLFANKPWVLAEAIFKTGARVVVFDGCLTTHEIFKFVREGVGQLLEEYPYKDGELPLIVYCIQTPINVGLILPPTAPPDRHIREGEIPRRPKACRSTTQRMVDYINELKYGSSQTTYYVISMLFSISFLGMWAYIIFKWLSL